MFESCKQCTYAFDAGDGGDLQCRFNPPIMYDVKEKTDTRWGWPRVDESDWCGKYCRGHGEIRSYG